MLFILLLEKGILYLLVLILDFFSQQTKEQTGLRCLIVLLLLLLLLTGLIFLPALVMEGFIFQQTTDQTGLQRIMDSQVTIYNLLPFVDLIYSLVLIAV